MAVMSKIQLRPESISDVPLQIFEQDFTFIVNGEEFKTSRLISDLLSPKISQMHSSDPTIDTFLIDTHHKGNFSILYRLLNFKENDFSSDEFFFISEVLESLGNAHIDFFDGQDDINTDNVLSLIANHTKYEKIYSKSIQKEIDFISLNFSQLFESIENEEKFSNLSINTILSILDNKNLRLNDEDQLLRFVNKLYLKDSKISPLFEKVQFINLSKNAIKEFFEIYDFNDISGLMWNKLAEMLIGRSDSKSEEKGITFSVEEKKLLSGIINYILNKSSINDIDVTSSSFMNNDDRYHPKNVVLYENNDKCFLSENEPNSWICIDFKDCAVHPTDYIIRSPKNDITNHYLKNWVIEGSNDKIHWEVLDKQNDCEYLVGSGFVHTFTIQNQNYDVFRFIRLKQNGPNVFNSDYLAIDNFELYGRLV